MKIYIVPPDEEYRFAQSLERDIITSTDSHINNAVLVIKSFDANKYNLVKQKESFFNYEWDIVCSENFISEVDRITYNGDDYFNYWMKYFSIRINSRIYKKVKNQANFSGYDFFFQYIKKLYYSGDHKMEDIELPAIYEFFNLMAVGRTDDLIKYYFRLSEHYGYGLVYNSILSFLNKTIDYIHGDRESLSWFYEKVIKNFITKVSLQKITKILAYMFSDLPISLRIPVVLREFDSKIF